MECRLTIASTTVQSKLLKFIKVFDTILIVIFPQLNHTYIYKVISKVPLTNITIDNK